MTDARIVLGVETSELDAGTQRAAQSLRSVGDASNKTKTQLNQTGNTFNKSGNDAQRLSTSLNSTKTAIIGLGSAYLGLQGVTSLIRQADAATTLDNRVRSVTKGTADFNATQKELFRIAQQNKQALTDTTSLYFGLVSAFTDVQKAQFPVLGLTEKLGQALFVTGVNAQQAQSFILQLSQAAASDFKAVGEEINSLISAAPALTKAISEELGLKSAGAIKKFAEDGNLSTKTFFEAFNRASVKFGADAQNMTVTVGQALTQLDNAFLNYIGRADAIKSGSNSIALAISGVANNIDVLAGGATILAGILAGKLAQSLAISAAGVALNTAQAVAYQIALARMAAVSTTAAVATGALNGALGLLARNPVLLIVAGLTTAYVLLGDETDKAKQSQEAYDAELQKAKGLYDQINEKSARNVDILRQQQQGQLSLAQAALITNKALFEQALAVEQNNLANARSVRGIGIRSGMAIGAEIGNSETTNQGLATAAAEKAYLKQIKLVEDLQSVLKTGKTTQELSTKATMAGAEATAASSGALGRKQKASTDAAQAIKKQADEQNRLNETLVDRNREIERGNLTLLMNEQQKAVAGVKFELEDLARKTGGFTSAQQKLASAYIAGTAALEKRKKQLEDTKQAEKELADEAKRAAEEYARIMQLPIENAIRGIQESFVGLFESGLKGELNSFKDFFSSIKNLAIKTFSEMAALELFGAGGLAGLIGSVAGGGRGGSVLGGGSGGGGGSGIGGLLREGSSLLGSTKIGGAINAFGAKSLPSIFAKGAIGPTTLKAGLGGAPAAGGLLGGAGIGLSAIALPIAGLAIGAIASSLFKSKPKSIASNFGGTLNAEGGLDNEVIRTNGKGNPETAKALSKGVSDLAQGLIAAGVDVSGKIIQGGVDAGKGFLGVGNTNYLDLRNGGGNAVNFNPNGGEKAVTQAFATLALQLARTSEAGAGFTSALSKVQAAGRTAEAVISDVAFILNFEKLGDTFVKNETRVTEFEQSIFDLRKQFDDAKARATVFGLSLDTLAKNLTKAEGELRKQFNKSIEDQLVTSSPLSGLVTELQRYKDQLREAQLIGGNIQRVELLHQSNMQKLIGETNNLQLTAIQEASTLQINVLQSQSQAASGLAAAYGRVAETLKSALDEINIGQFSILSPAQQLAESKKLFDSASSRASQGDIEAANQLPSLANNLLTQGQSFFASGEDFAALQRETVKKLEDARAVATSQVDIQSQIFKSNEEQVRAIQQSTERQVRTLQGGFDSVRQAIDNAALSQLSVLRGGSGKENFANFNERAVALFGGGLTSAPSGIASQIEGILNQTARGVTAGNNRRTDFFASNAGANEQAFALARQLGIKGFANGGTFSGTGLVGEKGAEFITTGSAATVVPYQANAEVVKNIRASNDNMVIMVNIMQSGFSQTVDALKEILDATREGSRAARVSGKRKEA